MLKLCHIRLRGPIITPPRVTWLLCVLLAACGPGLPNTDAVTVTAPPTTLPTSKVGENEDDRYVHLTPPQLALALEDKDFLLINTHAPYGFEIEHTDAHIPLDDEGRWLGRYPADKATKIVLYCRSGQWSSVAARELVAAGYANVWHLDGGMVAWHAEGLPLKEN
jgi:phage shock protein E